MSDTVPGLSPEPHCKPSRHCTGYKPLSPASTVAFSRSPSSLAGSGARSSPRQPRPLLLPPCHICSCLRNGSSSHQPGAHFVPPFPNCQDVLDLLLQMSSYPSSQPLPLTTASETTPLPMIALLVLTSVTRWVSLQ